MEKEGVCAICCAYNHGKYIRQAIEGFINQHIDIPYKIIIHDDASTDGTKEIIKEYANKYPDILMPIYQQENKYSQGIDVIQRYILPYIEYSYVAICEGDDYWTDSHKLEKQYNFMKMHPDVSLCVHNTLKIDVEGNPKGVFNESSKEVDYTVEEIIEADGGGLFHTSSYMLRSKLWKMYPEKLRIARVGDYPLAVFLALNGKVHYLDEVSSCYRVGVDNSWMDRFAKNKDIMVEHFKNMADYFEALDDYTEQRFHDICIGKWVFYTQESIALENTFVQLFTDRKLRTSVKRMPLKDGLKTCKRLLVNEIKGFYSHKY